MKKVRCLNPDCSILIEEESDKEKFELVKENGCPDCEGWELEFEPEDSGEEGEIKLITTKCPICSKLKGVEIPDWNALVEKYKEVEGFPKSKKKAISSLCWNIFEEEFCQCLKCFYCEKYFTNDKVIETSGKIICDTCARDKITGHLDFFCPTCGKHFLSNEHAELSCWEAVLKTRDILLQHRKEKHYCLRCEEFFDELFENKYCEACARESFFYSCKLCEKKFRFNEPEYAELSYQEVRQRVGEACIKHQEECSTINPQVNSENIESEDDSFSNNETEGEPVSNDNENRDERQGTQIIEIEEEENESQSDNQVTPVTPYDDIGDISLAEEPNNHEDSSLVDNFSDDLSDNDQDQEDSDQVSDNEEEDSTLNNDSGYARRFQNISSIYTNPNEEGWQTINVPTIEIEEKQAEQNQPQLNVQDTSSPHVVSISLPEDESNQEYEVEETQLEKALRILGFSGNQQQIKADEVYRLYSEKREIIGKSEDAQIPSGKEQEYWELRDAFSEVIISINKETADKHGITYLFVCDACNRKVMLRAEDKIGRKTALWCTDCLKIILRELREARTDLEPEISPHQPSPTPYPITESERTIKVQEDIKKIEDELNKFPNVLANQLENPNYKSQIINLADDDAQREVRCQEIIEEISEIRSGLRTLFEQIITNAQEILNNDNLVISEDSLQSEIETLKTIIKEINNSSDRRDWESEREQAESLLNRLRTKLSEISNQTPTPNVYYAVYPSIPSPNRVPSPDPSPQPVPEPRDNPVPPTPEAPERPNSPKPPPRPFSPPPPRPTPPLPDSQEEKLYGKDYKLLNPKQKEGRQEIIKQWKAADYQQRSSCQSCQKNFEWDRILSYLAAKAKSENELQTHQKTCSLKNNPEEIKRTKQKIWEEERASKMQSFYTCPKCWDKVVWDKSIIDAEQARKQALADINFHEKEECGTNKQRSDGHAPLSYANERTDLVLEKNNQGEVYQEKQQSLPLPVKILIGGGVTMLVLLIGYLVFTKRKKKT